MKMRKIEEFAGYLDEVGGVYSEGPIEALPYNHWKLDMEWLVLVINPPKNGAFIPVTAYTAREAACKAINEFKYIEEEDNDY